MAKDEALAHRVEPGSRVSLKDFDPDGCGPYHDKDDPEAAADLERDLARLSDLQQRLYAEARSSVLVVMQATDAAGKDGAINRVGGPLDARGVHVWSFRAPVGEELQHDYLWRIHARLPRRGEMAFFNRSHYEDILVPRVLGLFPKDVWEKRYDHINAFEKMLDDCGTRVVKFFLHISKDEQKQRLEGRIKDPDKRWKFDPRDLETRKRWDEYQKAYEDVLARCSTEHAPWYVVPANRKWFRDIAIARTLVKAVETLDPSYPAPSFDPESIVIT